MNIRLWNVKPPKESSVIRGILGPWVYKVILQGCLLTTKRGVALICPQVVWRDTKKVGVGMASQRDTQTGALETYIVAHYSPAGNVRGQLGEEVGDLKKNCKTKNLTCVHKCDVPDGKGNSEKTKTRSNALGIV